MSSTRVLLAARLMATLAKRDRKGFTLIELLVVVVIIGILASVALPSFVGAQDKARNASVQSNARTIQMAIEEYGTEHNGQFPTELTSTGNFIGNGTSYLPGGNMPKSPWVQGAISQTNKITADTPLLSVANSVGKGLPLYDENKAIDTAVGTVPTATNGWTMKHFGAIEYDYDTNTQYYVLYATGKKAKGTICVSSVSNAGQ